MTLYIGKLFFKVAPQNCISLIKYSPMMRWDLCRGHCRRIRLKRRKRSPPPGKTRCSTWKCECCKSVAWSRSTGWHRGVPAWKAWSLQTQTCPGCQWTRRLSNVWQRCWEEPWTYWTSWSQLYPRWMPHGWPPPSVVTRWSLSSWFQTGVQLASWGCWPAWLWWQLCGSKGLWPKHS